MAESTRTAEMYRGELDPEEGDRMPRSLRESYNASQSGNPPELEDTGEGFYSDADYSQELLQQEDALDAFGELWSED